MCILNFMPRTAADMVLPTPSWYALQCLLNALETAAVPVKCGHTFIPRKLYV